MRFRESAFESSIRRASNLFRVGQPGLMLVRGPNVMKGYLGRPAETEKAIRDGWYVTGDIATIDEDGFVEITDRLSRFSKIGGEMVPHIKVEEKLQELADANEQVFVVTGGPDEKKGERLLVLHTLDEGRLEGLPGSAGPDRTAQLVGPSATVLLQSGRDSLPRDRQDGSAKNPRVGTATRERMNDEALLHLCASAPTILCGKLFGNWFERSDMKKLMALFLPGLIALMCTALFAQGPGAGAPGAGGGQRGPGGGGRGGRGAAPPATGPVADATNKIVEAVNKQDAASS